PESSVPRQSSRAEPRRPRPHGRSRPARGPYGSDQMAFDLESFRRERPRSRRVCRQAVAGRARCRRKGRQEMAVERGASPHLTTRAITGRPHAPMQHSALLNVMIAAARKAARALKRDFGELEKLQVSLKGPGNFVSAADRRAEETLHAELTKARPGYGFLGEESGPREGADKTHTWIVDPLDGTTNFLHGIPQFAISIALERESTVVAGLIY